jgi:hypothetical protein
MTYEEIKNLLRENWATRYTTEEIDTILEILDYFHTNKGELENGLSHLQTNYVDVSRIQNLNFERILLEDEIPIWQATFNVFSNAEEKVYLTWRG